MGLFFLLLLGVAAMALGGGSGAVDAGVARRETLLEPPDASHTGADYLVELDTTGGPWRWTVYGKPGTHGRKKLGSGEAPSRDEAVDDAYDVIEKERGKLPAPVLRHGLRLSADCSTLQVQALDAWLAWAEPQVDVIAGRLEKEKRLSGAQLMRGVFERAFPECPEATPKVRASTWGQTTRRVNRIVQKQLAGEFLDLNPIGRVLAAKMVNMNPPKVDGRAFWHDAKNGTPWAVLVDRAGEDGMWRWRIWIRTVDGDPVEQRAATSEAKAASEAKAYIDGLPV